MALSAFHSTAILRLWSGFRFLEHQTIGVEWMLSRERDGTEYDGKRVFGGFQCDDMGLGKTIQILATMRNNLKKSTLIVCPLAMMQTWADVSERSGFTVYTVLKDSWHSELIRANRPAVYIINYEKIIWSPSLFLGEHTAWDRVVLDEAHKIRNPYSVISKRITQIRAPLRWVVTGTPLVNSLRDVVSQLAFLGFSHDDKFRWDKGYLDLLPKILMHRSMDKMRAVLSSAPPVPSVTSIALEFDNEREEEFYSAVRGEIDARLAARYAKDNAERLELLMRMRQISVHPQVYINSKKRKDEEYDQEPFTGPSTKFNALARIIEEDRAENGSDHKYLVFCSFHDEMYLLQQFLQTRYSSIELYHGGMSKKERDEALERARKPECSVLLIQLQSGGVGLNLQEFDRCVFMSPWWTAALMQQAIARTVRMGQIRVVKVFHLILRFEEEMSSIDLMMNRAAERKAYLLEWLFNKCSAAGAVAIRP